MTDKIDWLKNQNHSIVVMSMLVAALVIGVVIVLAINTAIGFGAENARKQSYDICLSIIAILSGIIFMLSLSDVLDEPDEVKQARQDAQLIERKTNDCVKINRLAISPSNYQEVSHFCHTQAVEKVNKLNASTTKVN